MAENNTSFQDFLNDEFIKWMVKDRRARSQNDFARYLEVSAASLSQWMSGTREPAGDNIHKLGDKLGPRVYEILGLPPMMPRDPGVMFIAKLWPRLNDDQKQRILDVAEEMQFQTKT